MPMQCDLSQRAGCAVSGLRQATGLLLFSFGSWDVRGKGARNPSNLLSGSLALSTTQNHVLWVAPWLPEIGGPEMKDPLCGNVDEGSVFQGFQWGGVYGVHPLRGFRAQLKLWARLAHLGHNRIPICERYLVKLPTYALANGPVERRKLWLCRVRPSSLSLGQESPPHSGIGPPRSWHLSWSPTAALAGKPRRF